MDVEHTHIQWKMRSQHFSYHMTLFSSNTERILDIFQCFVFSIFVCLPLCTFWLLSSSWINMCGEEKKNPSFICKKKKQLTNSLPNSSTNGAQGLGFFSFKAPDLVVFHHYNSPLFSFFLSSPWTTLAFVSACHSSVNAMKADSRDAQSQ